MKRRKRIVAAYVRIGSAHKVARRFGVSKTAVCNYVRAAGAHVNSKPQRFEATAEQLELVAQMWKDGSPCAHIGMALGVRGAYIPKRILAELGLTFEKRLKRKQLVRNGYGYTLALVPESSPFVSMRHGNGYVPEHRLVMAQALGRPLESTETVHHMNGIRDDNRIENLQLISGGHGRGHARQCGDCGSMNVIDVPID